MLNQKSSTVTPLFAKLFPSSRFQSIECQIIDKSDLSHGSLNQTSIKILNWNIAKNNHNANWQKDFLWIVEKYAPDIIFLQEVRLCSKDRHMGQISDMNWNFAPNFVDTYKHTYFGVLTAAKSKCIARESMVSIHSEPITKTPKISLLSEYSLSSIHNLLTINTHMINFVNLSKFKAQIQELESRIALHQGPIILSGDFNTWNYSRWYLLNQMTDKLGLIKAAFSPQDNNKIKRFLLSPPLDYIFYRGLTEKPSFAQVIDHISSSDHKPMVVEFSCC
ncbi:MAG: endonuclease/exonuclease/phosphatase family protein [Calothrix sp. MO_192.B10]|nr:endonuclease/exonuclease/phosphatase family protein [Calothrix sp. MO_192.B10]